MSKPITLKEFREFTKDLPDDTNIQIGESLFLDNDNGFCLKDDSNKPATYIEKKERSKYLVIAN